MGVTLREINWINIGLGSLCALLLLLALFNYALAPKEIFIPELSVKKNISLPASFALKPYAYEKIDSDWTYLKSRPHKLQLPDLRQILTYHGVNGRPDAPKQGSLMHFGIAAQKRVEPLWEGQRLYLDYDKRATPPTYIFSKNNKETALWIEAENGENEAVVKASMVDEEGELIEAPLVLSEFKLQAKELVRSTAQNREGWELGKNRVDGTLLARQHARWWGVDRFIENHGGDEFLYALGKHRLDFGEGPSIYSVFVELGACLIWQDGRWQNVEPGEASLGKPLLYVKKVDERLMSFELWDESGQRKIPLTILRANEVWAKDNLQREFQFLGARTRSQCVFEVGDQRILLKPHDWLLLTEEGWVKLETVEEIDDYVERRVSGPLFVFDGMVRRDEHQLLCGTLYNASRTDSETLELAVTHGAKAPKQQEFKVIEEFDEETAYGRAGDF
jgi:hypothetical protein